MALKEPTPNPLNCGICGKPKERLKRLTEQTHEPILVCATTPPKGKMPCDGWVFVVAEKHDKPTP